MRIHDLQRWKDMDVTTVPKNELVDICTVRLDPFAPIEVRMDRFLEQIKNPYCFSCHDTPVQISFSENAQTLHTCLYRYFVSRKQV